MGVRLEDMPFLVDFCRMCADGWTLGYHERNGGNASYRLTEADVESARSFFAEGGAWVPLGVEEGELADAAGSFLLVTAAGKYLRNVSRDPAANCGIVEVSADGRAWRPVWGFTGGARPTSELRAHLMAHAVRMRATDGRARVLYHAHPSSVVALSALEAADARVLTRLLWVAHTESMVAFPEGVGACPWMVPGSLELARASAEQFARFAACIWQLHGVFASGATCDEALGLVHAIDKAADIVLRVRAAAAPGQTPALIGVDQLRAVAQAYDLPVNAAFLD